MCASLHGLCLKLLGFPETKWCAGATPTYHTAYQAVPLFRKGQMVYDCFIYIWVHVSHVLLTFWPLCGFAIMAGAVHLPSNHRPSYPNPRMQRGRPF